MSTDDNIAMGYLQRAMAAEEALRLSEQRLEAEQLERLTAQAEGIKLERALEAAEQREAALRQACLDALKMVNQGMWEEAMETLALAAQQPESEAS